MRLSLLTILLFINSISFSQQNIIYLKSGQHEIEYNFDILNQNEKYYRYVLFSDIPSTEQINQLKDIGINLLEYLPKNMYICSIDKLILPTQLEKFNVISLNKILPSFKIDKKLKNNYPDWAYKNGELSLKLILHKDAKYNESLKLVQSKYEKVQFNDKSLRIFVTIDESNLLNLASLEFISFIEPIDPPSLPENKTGRTLHRSNTVNVDYNSSISRKYNGDGVKVMMQDDGIVGPHIDRQGRLDQSFCVGCSSSGSDHGDHVSGTIMGAGNLDPLGRGMADGSFLYVYGSSNNNYYDVPNLYNNYDVTITSKSYSNGCNAGYTSLAQDLDLQTNDHPSLIHVFSAGNDGTSDCGYGAGSGWGNVTGGHKQAKNVIAVANLTSIANLANSSSRGPAEDGRIKPDISAKGTSVYSTEENQTYGTKTGTSMSCPGISGVMAQLYHAYKNLNGNVNPPSGLMKCLMLNTADDIGNPGPDFKHGWGVVNSLRAVKAIENNNFLSSSIEQNLSNTHNITVPSNTLKLKVMVYWHDKEGSTTAAKSLVNDINIQITDPSGQTFDPWVLNTTPSATLLDQNATRGIDDLNNMEQVTIDNPQSGIYNLTVGGYSIPFGPQEYFVSYEIITEDLKLTYPIGGESIVPGSQEIIRWDTHLSGSLTIEYSTNGGTTWGLITNSANAENGYYYWNQTMPVTDSALIRISNQSFSSQSDHPFTVVSVPTNVNVYWPCPDSINVSWNSVSGATSYEVSMLGQEYMDSMVTTTNTNAWFINPNPSITDSWFSVCSKVNNGKGRRAIAVNQQSINAGCLAPPTASFTSSNNVTCSGVVSFYDNSLNLPSSWIWNFGDGNTSILQNPTHTYTNQGIYDVSLVVSNALGSDTVLYTSFVDVSYISPPVTFDDTVCQFPASFSLGAGSSSAKWYTDTLGSAPIYTGSIYNTPIVSSPVTYYVKEFGGSSIFGGANDNTIGNGGYFNNYQYLIMDCYSPSKIVSFDVFAGTAQSITFELRDANSTVIDDTTISVQTGKNTLFVDFDVPVGNNLQLGVSANNSDLYRNSDGANYPYNFGNIATITGSSATTSTGYYYFFYNIQMRETCVTFFAPVNGVLVPGLASYSNQNVNICSGQSYTIGSSSYSTPGMYVDTILNNSGCDSIVSTTLNVTPTYTVNNIVSICKGDTYTIGQSSYNSSGIYTDVLLDSQGCDSTVVTDLTVTEVIATVAQSGGYLSANVSSGLPPYTYTWNTGETGSNISITSNGQYWVMVTDANGCASQKYFITVSSLPSSTFEVNLDDINIYPNPTGGVVNIELSNNIKYSDYEVQILNNVGEVVYEDINSKLLLMNNLSSGIYTIRLVFSDKIFHSQIIVK